MVLQELVPQGEDKVLLTEVLVGQDILVMADPVDLVVVVVANGRAVELAREEVGIPEVQVVPVVLVLVVALLMEEQLRAIQVG